MASVCSLINQLVQVQRQQENASEEVKRYALFPILDETGFKFYQKQEISHWTASELDFVADKKSYDNASPIAKRVIDTILAFFLSGDGAISDNIIFRFLLECQTYEEKAMFISQLHIELVHAETYGMAALTLKRDPQALASLIETVMTNPCVTRKINFMEKYMLADRPRYQRLLAFACAEGIFFCTLFAVIFWFRSKGMFPNFILANELIAKDESLHRDFGAWLYVREVSNILSKFEKGSAEYQAKYQEIKDVTLEIIKEALDIEDSFADFMLSENLEDLNANDLKEYARLISDNLLVQLSYTPHWKAKNPFTWLNDISMEQKSNFYEVRPGAYARKSLSEVLNWKQRAGLTEVTDNAYKNPDEVDF